MADIAYHTGLLALRRSPAAVRPGLWRRMFDAVWYAQQRRAMRDIDRVVAGRAGMINDSLEREIEQRMFDYQSRFAP